VALQTTASFRFGARVRQISKVPKITRLQAQKKRKDRVNVYLDGEYAFGVQAAVALPLRVGQELDGDAVAALKRRDAFETAHDQALRFLSYRPRSCFEIDRYLQRKGTDPEVIAEVKSRLIRAGLLDDAAFARYWVENREAFRPRGAWGLRYELRQKGIADEVIAEALEGLDPEDSAYRAARGRARSMSHLDHRTFRERIGGFLRRRGFSYGVIRPVVERLWGEIGEPEEDEHSGHWTSGNPEDDIDVTKG